MDSTKSQLFDLALSTNFAQIDNRAASTSSQPCILIVFINGLMLPQAMWTPTIEILKSMLANNDTPIAYLTYDRYGQGQSRPPNSSEWKPQPHDLLYSVQELNTVITNTITANYAAKSPPKILMVSHSIGVPLARLYSAHHHHDVSAHLFLDSNIANTDFVSIFPDPDHPKFNPSDLPADAAIDDLRSLRQRTRQMFHPTIPNAESLDRSNLPTLLPDADAPKLEGPNGTAPFLTVVGHDPDAFADEGLKLMKTPKGLNEKYMQPFWEKYNENLLKLTDLDKAKGVIFAKGAGHFIQKDNPHMVAEEIVELVRRLTEVK